jgi:NitT/TauT family transport system substrate-binding protein
MKRNAGMWLAAIMVAAALVLAGCGKPAKKFEPVSYRLKWLFNASVIGDIYADAEKFFAANQLAVTVKAGGPERDAIKELELGHAQFGVASADQIIRAVAQGSPVVVIAQIFQINPLQWIYRPANVTIDTPEDLKGKRIGITYGGNDETIMRALLKKYKIPETQVTLFSVRYDYTPFYEGKADLWPVYRNAEGVFIENKLAKAGESVKFFDPNQAGIRFVANSLVTTQTMLDTRADTVKRFVTALRTAWEQALAPANGQKALTLLAKMDKDTPPELMREQLDLTRKLVRPSAQIPFGHIDTAAWKETEAIMLAEKLIPAPVHIETRLHPM